MIKIVISNAIIIAGLAFGLSSCVPNMQIRSANNNMPRQFKSQALDSTQSALINWREIFADSNLISLIDTALKNNQELNILLSEIEVAKAEVRARKGEYLPSIKLGTGAEMEKVGRYTRDGVVEHNHEIREGQEFPEPFTDYFMGTKLSWELDIWKKLRNAKKSALLRYLSTVEGRNYMVTRLIAEIANAYYELLALDEQLRIVNRNIEIQQAALETVRLQKQSAQVTELAVKKFEAEVLKNRSQRYEPKQKIIETENEINFLVGRFPQPVKRSKTAFRRLAPDSLFLGIPSQLLANRPDIRQAELELEAAKLDVKAAKAEFYPSVEISSGIGFQGFNPKYLLITPASLVYSLAGDLVAPLVNRNAIKAEYLSANAEQLKAVYNYEQRILNAYTEVINLQSKLHNLGKSYELKQQEVDALSESIAISANLFKSAKADYMEVLMTQRDALEATMELVETKKERLSAFVNMYQALGGGWR